ncbi:hypothetical protein AA23498_1944 [Acetobacter nitrogenifigens DSM 23921 = NBRC 105050]|uniref:DUF4393 domain-containing protein n=1 Tax=Acetobacter nitrogenifigens DSM 23921 = NBRC 105050 TaxID=1120919 RepID=A0A511XC88_9PROT|nr:hypothetical protein [Acetobacter nitrogenifigens]GBQ94176.1 hypothetical protein AA23498_1944 [Acetobacter nitrogenifigens DSM 23921 = NBRC 105050]GEN60550.1 hypothetical protein ANI02nite_24340 [Acetobacter nitrogenifigens DSM 23921 = NBRC 105050]
MNSLIPQDPESLVHAADAIGHTIKNVPGLYDAVYETIAHVWIDPIRRRRRAKNLQYELEMAEKMIEGKQRLDDVSAKVAKEILEPAMEEDREELQKLWAALIARLLTGQLSSIRKEWIEVIKSLEVVDAAVLKCLGDLSKNTSKRGDGSVWDALDFLIKDKWPQVSIGEDEIFLSVKHLERIGLIGKAFNTKKELPFCVDRSGERFSYALNILGMKIVEITSPVIMS